MKTWQKVGIGVSAVVVLGGIVGYSVNKANKGVVTVQTAKVAPAETLISQVTASGEIKPTTYTNVTAQGFGRITSIVVKEGDHVKKGDVLGYAGSTGRSTGPHLHWVLYANGVNVNPAQWVKLAACPRPPKQK